MKIFGGGGSRQSRGADRPAEPKQSAKAKKPKKPRSTLKKVLLTILVVVLLIAGAGGIYLAKIIQPPSLAPTHVNDSTINDPENGDAISVDLNMGDRIDDFFTFAVCATDIDETRTDNIMVVAFDTKKHTVNVMNIPRDTMSNVNRSGAGRKINAAYGTKNGIEQTKKQIKQVMGFTPDKYMVVNFNGIAEIVDAIGGVDYDIPFPMMYKDPVQKLEINFPTAGPRHLNGEEVVEFLRWRKNGTGYTKYVPAEYKNGDETRIKKQQEFLMYLAKEVLTIKNAPNYKKIADAVFKNVKTDITAGEMIWLAGQAFQVDTTNGIKMFTMPGYSAMSAAGNSTELSFFFINESKALKLINEYFNPYDKKITGLDLVSGPTKGSSSGSKNNSDDDDDEPSYSHRPSEDDEEDENSSSGSGSGSGRDPEGSESGNSNSGSGSGSESENGSGGESGNSDSGSDSESGGSNGGSGNESGGSTGGSTGGETGGNESGGSSSGETSGGGESGSGSGGSTGGSGDSGTAAGDPEA
ncbi:MAG: LCP family protein [Clostridiaceae bacterium]|nr:LCP family protein [Clostridiaceae bacterium]